MYFLTHVIAVCGFYLGMTDGYYMYQNSIPDGNIIASSSSSNYPAWYARLNGESCWVGSGSITPWIQADIGHQTNISGVVTQGDGGVGSEHWITKIKVSTFSLSTDDTEVFVKDGDGNVIVSITDESLCRCDFCNMIKVNRRRATVARSLMIV